MKFTLPVCLSLLLTTVVARPAYAQVPVAPTVPASAANAEDTPPGRPPQAFGTGVTVYTFPGVSMQPFNSSTTYGTLNGNRVWTGGDPLFTAPVLIPSGGLITSLELDGCDGSAITGLFATLYRCVASVTGCTQLASVSSSGPAVPGCSPLVTTAINQPTVDNAGFFYFVHVGFSGTPHIEASVGSVRIGWKRQVSPAPGAATFSDVPVGSPLHPFVEALVAAGITGGCGAGNYCPNSPLTRGQMAVFLAAALGLHWPN
jgi:hypothetical protein